MSLTKYIISPENRSSVKEPLMGGLPGELDIYPLLDKTINYEAEQYPKE